MAGLSSLTEAGTGAGGRDRGRNRNRIGDRVRETIVLFSRFWS